MAPTKRANASPRPKATRDELITDLSKDSSYDFTVSPDGVLESSILLHSRMGIRIDFNLHRNALDLWLSPRAGTSVDYHDRNFSCRDDHTSIFDKILFPELGAKRFVSCDYDPFHSILRFERQSLHLASLLDKPVVLVWAEKEEVVDIKCDKQDSLLTRAPGVFAVRHPDRGKQFEFAAVLGGGAGAFWHQPEVDTGRSTWARVVLAPGQLLVLSGELVSRKVMQTARAVARAGNRTVLSRNERLIAQQTRPGAIVVKDNPELQKLYDTNVRHLLSVQDASGAIRAALKYVYYLIWTTDGSVTSASMSQAGWQRFLRLWLEFMLANPTSQSTPPKGRFYGQLTNGRISKREEFGVLCAVWPAFMYWGMTGDKTFVSGTYLKVLEDAVDWVERYCFDPKMGALGTYYLGGGSEDPFIGSTDFGWDAAVGRPMARNQYAPQHEGRPIERVYEFGMNLNMYNIYLMLASVHSGAARDRWVGKARRSERFLQSLLARNTRALYKVKGRTVLTPVPYNERFGGVECGLLAVQNRSAAFYMPDYARLFLNRMRSYRALTKKTVIGLMPCGAYGRLAGLDTEFVDEKIITQSLEVSLPYHVEPSFYNPIPYTMGEVMGAKSGEYHDIRPQAFSAGPFQAAVTNLAIRTMPFGIAVRGSNYLKALRQFEYRGGHVDVTYRGKGAVSAVTLNGTPLANTLQLPDNRLSKGANRVVVTLAARGADTPTLVYSTVRLRDVRESDGAVAYDIEGFGQCVLVLRNVKHDVVVTDTRGATQRCTYTRSGKHLFVEFFGFGEFVARAPRSARPKRDARQG
jgi:hypothetical protein